jgi:hypothetical protein
MDKGRGYKIRSRAQQRRVETLFFRPPALEFDRNNRTDRDSFVNCENRIPVRRANSEAQE